jgi:(heptosyl)LPS beta-1,4-glucosyltransferase
MAEATLPLTVAVLTLDEERHIGACLAAAAALRPAEVLVLDSGSRDATARLAAAAGARVVTRPFDGYASQRNAALALVATEWVYFVDADERVTPAQATEVRRRLASEELAGYHVPRDNRILGRSMRGGGWWPDYQLRLFRVAAGRYDASRQVHELVRLDGPVGYLDMPLIHYNYDTWRQVLAKQRRYTARAVRDALAAGQTIRPRNYLLQPWRAFWRRYVIWAGYRDGWLGLRLALVLAAHELLFYVWLGRARRAARPESAILGSRPGASPDAGGGENRDERRRPAR